MRIRKSIANVVVVAAALMAPLPVCAATARKIHTVSLGAARNVPYSRAGDPGGAEPGEDSLRIRALIVDGVLKEWTTGDAHDVTDRSFVVRRVIRLNDALPGDQAGRPRGRDIGYGSAGRGCWWTVSPGTSSRSGCPTMTPV